MRRARPWRTNQSEDDRAANTGDTIVNLFFVTYSSFSFKSSSTCFPLIFNRFDLVFVMHELSNDTATWTIIDSDLVAPLFVNVSIGSPLGHQISSQTGTIEAPAVNYWAFILIFFPLFTIFGNVLVVISVYREKSLHTVTNYFVVSLAISDITVAAVVMPFAIYLEFNRVWELSERLCDFWVAADCMACTASILNLVAIAVDRYIAVTKPLKYARHKNPKRVAIMIVIVWLVSFFIALPIVGGVNKSDVDDYPRVSDQCAFFNNKFLIFSSLGSFFIPCIIIFAIYYRIFMVIMSQAKKTRQQLRPKAVIESAAAQHRSNADHLITSYYNERASIVNPTSIGPEKTSLTLPIDINETAPIVSHPTSPALQTQRNSLMLKLSTPVLSAGLRPSINVTSSSNEPMDDDERDDTALVIPHEQQNGIESNEKSNPMKTTSIDGDQHHCHYPAKRVKMCLKSKTNPSGASITSVVSSSTTNQSKLAKRKAYSRMKKERKATQTLIIVLICFLVCWLPFFVLNNLVNAIVKLSNKSPTWLITDFTLSLCVWLGYINSFLNPIIYTIFNLEFRKAFAKILFSFCRISRQSFTSQSH